MSVLERDVAGLLFLLDYLMEVELQFVERVLNLKESGKPCPEYEALISQLRATDEGLDDVEIKMKSNVLFALGRLGQRLVASQHATLLGALFACKSERELIARGLVSALAAVVSNKATLVGGAFSAALGGLATNAHDLDTSAVVVAGLSTLIDLCPQGTNELVSTAKQYYPWKGLSTRAHVAYARVLLALSQNRPLLEPFLLQLVVERALELDAEVDVADLPSSSQVQDKVEEQLFELDIGATREEEKEDEEEEEPSAAAKLDSIMCLVFDHVESRRDEEALLESTMAVFESAVLLTHKSRFVQFFVFRVCTSNRKRSHYFVEKLVNMIVDDSSNVVRRGAAVYLASFVSRAISVGADLAARCASFFFEWIEHSQQAGGEEDKSLYYATFQAFLYVMCFRGDEILISRKPFSREEIARWQTLLKKGDGLEKCDARIRVEFLQVCDRSNVFSRRFVDDVAKTIQAMGGDDDRKIQYHFADDDHHQFFFPFDPYLLPRSKTYVVSTYRDWEDTVAARREGDDDDDDDESGDDEDESDDDDEADDDVSSDDDEPSHMSVSPGILSFQHSPHASSYENSALSFENSLRRHSAPLHRDRRSRLDSAGSYNSDW